MTRITLPAPKAAYEALLKTAPGSMERKAAVRLYQAARRAAQGE